MSDFLCFVHIERAGGTTLHHVLRQNHPLRYLTLEPWYYRANDPDSVFTAGELRGLTRMLPRLKGIGGHTTRCYLDYESVLQRPVRYLTFLREPLSRYRSHFRYQKIAMGIDWELDDFLADPQFHNFMTVRLAGEPDLAKAMRALDDFACVGLSEDFERSLLLMRDALGWKRMDLRYQSQNAVAAGQLGVRWEEVEDRVQENNRLDMELYRYAREELFPQQIRRYQGNLESDLGSLQRACQDYRAPIWKRALWGGWRKLGHLHLERWLQRRHHSPREA